MKVWKFIPLLVVAAGLLAYHNSFTGPFIFDDADSILENPTIRHLWPIWQALSPPHRGGLTVEGRPLINLSLAVNYALGGYQVWGYHALNLTIHILAGLTLLGVVRRTLLQPTLRERFSASANGLALATAVLWTVHPLATESVTYVIQRAESLMGLFYLLTLYCFIRGTGSPRPRFWFALAIVACLLGMASKEVMVSAPLVVMLYDRTFLSSSFREAWRRRWPLYLSLASTWIVLGYLVIFTGSLGNHLTNAKPMGITWWAYFLTEPGVILHYLRLSVWPHPLCLDYYGWPIARTWMSVSSSGFVMAILLGAGAWAWKTNSAWGFLGACFFLILAPSSSFILLDSPAFEHRMYLPLAAVVAMVTVGGFELGRDLPGLREQTRRMLEWGVGGALVLVLALLTIQRNREYRSALTIWQDTVVKCPNNPRAHNNLGLVLLGAGNVQEAVGQFEQALRIRPNYADAHDNLGVALKQTGKLEEAVWHYEQALRIKPNHPNAHYNLGVTLEQAGKLEEAIKQYEQALRIKPDYAEAHNNLGNAFMHLDRVQEAVGQFEQVLRIKPDHPNAHYNLGVALTRLGKAQEAVGQFEQALRIKPDSAEVQNNLAWLLATLAPIKGGSPLRAVTLAQGACELTSNQVATYLDTLAVAYAAAGRFHDAIATSQKAVELARAAGRPELVGEIEVRLELYRGGHAYDESVDVPRPGGP